MINCLIIDDEPLARELLIGYCGKVPTLNLVSSFSDGIVALSFLRTNQVDLIFLDIKMPDISGLDLMKIIDPKTCVVFTTAFSEYALEGFELNATDYLLKPFDFPRFLRAVDKVIQHYESRSERTQSVIPKEHLFVKEGRELVKIFLEDLLYIKGTGDYVTFFMKDKKVMSLMTLKDLERDLSSKDFLRIHQSFIVNPKWIVRILKDRVEVNNTFIPISRTYKHRIENFLERNG